MYIYQSTCISPQQTFLDVNIEVLNASRNNALHALEPKYTDIPLGLLRRMGKAVRMGVGAALPITQTRNTLDGIILGTGNGGMEDCIKFLNQIVEYEEGRLTPTNFVQSTPNAIAAQIGLSSKNTGYNITHVHRGLAFENALLDAKMKLEENPKHSFLVGGLDEISDYNFNIEALSGAYKQEITSNINLYETDSSGTLAGEGVAMFEIGSDSSKAIAQVKDVYMAHSEQANEVQEELIYFLKKNGMEFKNIDVLISGENGDNSTQSFYSSVYNQLDPATGIVYYKHYFGEFPTVSALSLWLGTRFLQDQNIPRHFVLKPKKSPFKNILFYNHYKGLQHGFMLLVGK